MQKAQGIELEPPDKPIKVYNVDGTLNKWGTITHLVTLNIEIHGRTCKEQFLVTGLGIQRIILEFPWLEKMNPIIDWVKGTLEWRKPKSETVLSKKETQSWQPTTITEEKDEEEHLNST